MDAKIKLLLWSMVKIIKMKAEGCSQGDMSRRTGLAYGTVKSYLRKINAGE